METVRCCKKYIYIKRQYQQQKNNVQHTTEQQRKVTKRKQIITPEVLIWNRARALANYYKNIKRYKKYSQRDDVKERKRLYLRKKRSYKQVEPLQM